MQVRLNLLPQLLNEAYAHMQSCLSASILARKLFVMPFHRNVKVDLRVIEAMRSALAYCQRVSPSMCRQHCCKTVG